MSGFSAATSCRCEGSEIISNNRPSASYRYCCVRTLTLACPVEKRSSGQARSRSHSGGLAALGSFHQVASWKPAKYPRGLTNVGSRSICAGDLVNPCTGPDVARPANKTGDADAAFIDRTFPAFHPAIPTPAIWSVVAEIQNDRVFRELQFVQPRQTPGQRSNRCSRTWPRRHESSRCFRQECHCASSAQGVRTSRKTCLAPASANAVCSMEDNKETACSCSALMNSSAWVVRSSVT